MNKRLMVFLLVSLAAVVFLSGCVEPPVCGNGICELGEDAENCPQDCSIDVCGDGICGPTETPQNCPQDCGMQTRGIIEVVVSDSVTAAPVAGAEVEAKSGNYTKVLITDSQGKAVFANTYGTTTYPYLAPGMYTVTTTKEGYAADITQTELEAGETVEIGVELVEETSPGTGGFIHATIGNDVVKIVNGKKYPYEASNTDTSRAYWVANLGFGIHAELGRVLGIITVKNKIEAWDLSNPLWSEHSSLTEAGKVAAAAGGDIAHFLQGEESAPGYGFVNLRFDGFDETTPTTEIKIGDNKIIYTDREATKRTVPFYIRLPGIPQSQPTEQVFNIAGVNFYASCYQDIISGDGNCTYFKRMPIIGIPELPLASVVFNTGNTPSEEIIKFNKEGSLQDTYNYRQYYSRNDSYVYLLLDKSTDFSNIYNTAKIGFVGTDTTEDRRANVSYYWPDTEAFGNDPTDSEYLVAVFMLKAGGITYNNNFRVNIDTSTDKLIQFPQNPAISNYTSDVEYLDVDQPSWALIARSDTDSALHAGWTNFGTKAELTGSLKTATFTIPESRLYLSFTAMGGGAEKKYGGLKFDNNVSSLSELIKEITKADLPFLMNGSKSFRYVGSAYSTTMKETVRVNANARFVTQRSIKDLVAYMQNVGDFEYVLDMPGGIPAQNSKETQSKFVNEVNDNIIIPFLGKEYLVEEVDPYSAPQKVLLLNPTAVATYYEGHVLTGLEGTGQYIETPVSVKVVSVTQPSASGGYQVRVELREGDGLGLIDSQTVGPRVDLSEVFLDNLGAYALGTKIYISEIGVGPMEGGSNSCGEGGYQQGNTCFFESNFNQSCSEVCADKEGCVQRYQDTQNLVDACLYWHPGAEDYEVNTTNKAFPYWTESYNNHSNICVSKSYPAPSNSCTAKVADGKRFCICNFVPTA